MSTSDLIATMETRFVQAGARRIFVAEKGDGPPVLMLHGGGPGASGVSNYSRNIDALAERFRVIVPDMPGYGKSTKGVDRNDPFGDLSTGMIGLFQALGLKRVHIIGNSLGGACGLRMAIDRPDLVGRLVLMGPGGVDTTRGLPTQGLKRLLTYYKDEGPTLEKLTRFIRGDLVYDGSKIPEAVIRERFELSRDPETVAKPPLIGPKGIPNFKKLDFTRDPRLADVKQPTLVLWGADDKVNRPSGAQSLQRRMPNCDMYLFSRTGHWVQWERADEFNAVVISFLAQDAKA